MNYYWFLFLNGKLLLQKNATGYTIPYGTIPPLPTGNTHFHNVGEWNGISCKATEISSEASLPATETPHGRGEYQWTELRATYDSIPLPAYRIASKAAELLFWDRNSHFCPACGTPTLPDTAISKKCPHCGKTLFPPISPAILVLVHRGREVLLVHARTFHKPFYSLVAGFVETGETLEECVRREVREETALEIGNIRYFGSQEWPYPSQLMIGFEADYISGELCFADHELTNGGVYGQDNLPLLPQKLNLARKMIDSWLERTHQPG